MLTDKHRVEILMDSATYEALKRLAQADERSVAATIRHMVKKSAAARGLWTPGKPTVVSRNGTVEKP